MAWHLASNHFYLQGYVRLHTNLGDINLELHCDIVPRACENFLALCGQGYYDNTIFHRSIKNFMIQVGPVQYCFSMPVTVPFIVFAHEHMCVACVEVIS